MMGWSCLNKKQYVFDINKNYFLVVVDDCRDSYKTHMLNRNSIKGLLKLNYTRVNSEQQFMYEITSMQPIDKIFESEKPGYEDIRSILQGLCTVCENIKKYMLKPENIVLKPEMIFINPETKETKFLLNPYYNEPICQQLRDISHYFIGIINYTDIDAISCVYKFNEVVMKENFLIGDIVEVTNLSREEKSKKMLYVCEDTEDKLEATKIKKYNFFEKIGNTIRNRFHQQVVCEDTSEYCVDVIENENNMCEIGETILMQTIKEQTCTLSSCSPKYEDIHVPEKGAVLGKLEKNVDIVVNDISISRIHAKIELAGDKCYIEDLNTTNGTYVNGKRLIPYKLEEIKSGDKIVLGCVEYIINC